MIIKLPPLMLPPLHCTPTRESRNNTQHVVANAGLRTLTFANVSPTTHENRRIDDKWHPFFPNQATTSPRTIACRTITYIRNRHLPEKWQVFLRSITRPHPANEILTPARN
jgi:hypothetical protein